MMDDKGLVFLNETPNPDLMWGEKYFYRSSTSNTMREQLKDVVDSVLKVTAFQGDPLWVDIGGNDGYMLSQVPSHFYTVNVDPCNDSYKKEADVNCDFVIQDYFNSQVFKKHFKSRKASVVSCVSMFYDLSEPGRFLDDVYDIMKDEAVLVIQMSYTPLMIEQLEFSNICHEHKFYWSLFNLKELLEKHKFKIMDVSLNNTNAGSFRLFVIKRDANEKIFGSQTHRDVCKFRIKSLLSYEKNLSLDKVDTWHHFFTRINELKYRTVKFIREEVKKGKSVYGYGASTKGATMIGFFGLTNKDITAIADRSQYKHGLRTAGGDIPIISEEEMREKHPDYLFVMPFHFINEFVEREKEYLAKGGKMIVPLPKFEIIE
jgi:hypothetical protein